MNKDNLNEEIDDYGNGHNPDALSFSTMHPDSLRCKFWFQTSFVSQGAWRSKGLVKQKTTLRIK